MRIQVLLSVFIVSTIFFSTLSPIIQVHAGPYRDYSRLIGAFQSLASEHPTLVSFETVGQTVEGNGILMFKIGNPAGGKLLFDGAIHGYESLGSEVLYSYAQWLLTSNDSLAQWILDNDYTLIIPAVNVDEYGIDRKNANKVDLNRNFATNWKYGSYNPNSTNYHGPAILSEPESQTLARIFMNIKPDFYVNLHAGASELYMSAYGNKTYYSTLVTQMASLSKQRGVSAYYSQYLNGSGFGINDAMRAGVTSFLLEVSNQSTVSTSDIETIVLPRFMPVAIVLSQDCKKTNTTTPPWDINRDGKVDISDLQILANAYGTTPTMAKWNVQADLNENEIVDCVDLVTLALHYGDQYS